MCIRDSPDAAHDAARGAARGATPDAATELLGDQAGAMAIDVNGSALPSVLEEAAILYSNGQSQPAALALRQALGDTSLGGYQALAWLMLLDLHQALGDRAAFEALALEYAARFESSPPGWSEQLGAQASVARPPAARRIRWTASRSPSSCFSSCPGRIRPPSGHCSPTSRRSC